VLTEPPFELRPLEEELLCDVNAEPGVIVTKAYRLR
jgi:hypothetical protein